jgi:hypothetical protein
MMVNHGRYLHAVLKLHSFCAQEFLARQPAASVYAVEMASKPR